MAGIPPDFGQSDQTLRLAALGPIPDIRAALALGRNLYIGWANRGGLEMRFLVMLCATLVAACVSVGCVPELAPGQAWRLKEPRFGGANLTIGAIENRAGRKVVHASVSGLPGPPTDLPLFLALRVDSARTPGGEPLNFIASGIADLDGKWSPLVAYFTIPADRLNTTVDVPHIVVYEDGLRNALALLERSGPPLHFMFDENLKLWRDTEDRMPQVNDGGVKHPLSHQLDAILRGATKLASDPRMASPMGPPPPAAIEADEVPADDPALDERCREIVGINVSLSNIVVTRSEKWGHIWRADVRNGLTFTNEGMSRSVCWRKTSGEQPAVTSYPPLDAPR
jgi:hypothetical protein